MATETMTAALAAGMGADTHDAYNADLATVRNTTKEIFRRSRKAYHDLCIAKTVRWPEPTDALLLGIWTHLAVLEPDSWLREFVIAPKCDRRTTAGKQAYAAFCQEAEGKTVITAEQAAEVTALREAVMANRMARHFIEADGKHEHSVKWTDPQTGLLCKCRDDKLLASGQILDLKTTRDGISPLEFAKTAANLGYQRNADFYVGGHHEAFGERMPYLFLVVSKKTFECACYELDDAAMALGNKQNARTLGDLARCHETGNWLSEHETQITTLSLPRWAASSDEWEMS